MSMKLEFCPELQLDWSIENILFSGLSEIVVDLVDFNQMKYPDPVGRHGKDVLSWPTIFENKNRVKFVFYDCAYFNIRDEVSPGLSGGDLGEGKTFQRLLESELLTLHNNEFIEGLIHYRIITKNEIIDVLCSATPNIIIL